MIEVFLNVVYRFQYFIISFLVFTIVFGIYLSIKFNRFNFNVKNIKFYDIFLNLNNKSVLALSIIFIRQIFILWYLIYLPDYNLAFLTFLIISALLFNILINRKIGIIFDIINVSVLYATMILLKFLVDYTNDIVSLWYIQIVTILLIVFIVTYSIYFILRNINDCIVRR